MKRKLTREYIRRALRLIMFAHRKYGKVLPTFCNSELEYFYLDTHEKTGLKNPDDILQAIYEKLEIPDDSRDFSIIFEDTTVIPLPISLVYNFIGLFQCASKYVQICSCCGSINKQFSLVEDEYMTIEPICIKCLTEVISTHQQEHIEREVRLFKEQIKQYMRVCSTAKITYLPNGGVIARNSQKHIVGTFTKKQWDTLNIKTIKRDEIIKDKRNNITQVRNKKPTYQTLKIV